MVEAGRARVEWQQLLLREEARESAWLEYLSLKDETAVKEVSVHPSPMGAMMNDNRLGSLKQYMFIILWFCWSEV